MIVICINIGVIDPPRNASEYPIRESLCKSAALGAGVCPAENRVGTVCGVYWYDLSLPRETNEGITHTKRVTKSFALITSPNTALNILSSARRHGRSTECYGRD